MKDISSQDARPDPVEVRIRQTHAEWCSLSNDRSGLGQ
jgi:hypothetical protein